MTTATTERLRTLADTFDVPDLPELSEELVRSLDLPADLANEMAISEVAAVTGVSAHTLRYYERIGLVDVARDTGGRRVYDSQALARVVFLTRLRMSDMPIRDITHYIDLVRQGEPTVSERLALLQKHRESIRQRLLDLQAALAVVDYKITTYGGHCAP
ncbi:MAG: MerR family transcriptional regulator [Candidatus Dormibacteraceae bacterium]